MAHQWTDDDEDEHSTTYKDGSLHEVKRQVPDSRDLEPNAVGSNAGAMYVLPALGATNVQ